VIAKLNNITDVVPRSTGPSVIRKINELIDAFNGEPTRILICPHCGNDKWEIISKTLMDGSINFYTYMCKECYKNTKVRRVEPSRDPKVYLGPEDEVM
jgi:transcription elongation factor Elf1